MSTVVLIGKPNCGKSLLFNRLTGLRQKVSNFPGVTVEIRTGQLDDINICDYPGIYSLNPLTRDEEIAVENLNQALRAEKTKTVLIVLDVTRLERSLVLGLQVQKKAKECGKNVLFVANMIDEIPGKNRKFDADKFADEVGSPVLLVSAKTKEGLDELKLCLRNIQENDQERSNDQFVEPFESSKSTPDENKSPVEKTRSEALTERARELAAKFGPDSQLVLKNQTRIDAFFLSGFWGFLFFALIMTTLFQAIFTWSTPAMDLIETLVSGIGNWVTGFLPSGVISAFVQDALFGGFGSFLVFVPQIFILTFIIGVLEDSGYLARATIICHKPLSYFGLSGKSFVPYLSGHACAIPAIFAARTIESPKRRLITLLTIPLMACSARLPVYALLVTVLIPNDYFVGPFWGLRGLAFFGLYFFGLFLALLASGILSKTIYKSKSDAPFIIELPKYRLPNWNQLLKKSTESTFAFVKNAGLIIFTVTVVVWVLGYFPDGDGHLSTSWLASMGKLIEPIFKPLGLDWIYGVAILASFVAREVFVGTLGTLFGIENSEENITTLVEAMSSSQFSLASGVSLLVFYAIALQCASTLAVLKKETGNYKIPVATFAVYSLVAYLMALLTYVILS